MDASLNIVKHTILILLIISIVVTGIFLPYFPGDYDYFAVGLSHIFQFGTFASFLLVPTGLIWLILNITTGRNNPNAEYPFYLGKAVWVITTIIVLAAALGAFASHNRFSAVIILALGVSLFIFRKKIKPLSSVPGRVMPYYCIFIPLTVLLLRIAFLEKAKNTTTEFVIKKSEQLIHDIEAYKETNGHYPVSLLSTIEDYQPRVSGIPRFYYERSGEAYNLYFEQFSDIVGTQEIVMYNKLDEHEMTVHNQDLLRLAPATILRGYHKVVELPQQHWKIFHFD